MQRLAGKTFRVAFSDGVMKGRVFLHHFADDGSVSFGALNDGDARRMTRVESCEGARVSQDVDAVSYLGPGGYTLTLVLNHTSRTLVAFSSNERHLAIRNGTFVEEV
jgi:hypothetical protein